jgi:hypothetical protein
MKAPKVRTRDPADWFARFDRMIHRAIWPDWRRLGHTSVANIGTLCRRRDPGDAVLRFPSCPGPVGGATVIPLTLRAVPILSQN